MENVKLFTTCEIESLFKNNKTVVQRKAEIVWRGLRNSEFFDFRNAVTTIPIENMTPLEAKMAKMVDPYSPQLGGKGLLY